MSTEYVPPIRADEPVSNFDTKIVTSTILLLEALRAFDRVLADPDFGRIRVNSEMGARVLPSTKLHGHPTHIVYY